MTIAALLNRACSIDHRTADGDEDAYGNATVQIETVETVCELQQRQRDESTDREDLSVTQWLLVLPAGTVIWAGDTVTVDGFDYEVSGDPWEARNPFTQAQSHIEATVIRTSAADDDRAFS